MGQYLIPVLLLATASLSSSNVLPNSVNSINKEALGLEGEYVNNIFTKRYILDKIYNINENKPAMNKLLLAFTDPDNNNDDTLTIFNKNDNYNGEGFRKEQWHNYPRQLDRLHQTNVQIHKKRNTEPDPIRDQYTEEYAPDDPNENDMTNEMHRDSTIGNNNIYEDIIPANPLLILKIRLALNKDLENQNVHYTNAMDLENNNIKDNTQFTNENLNPKVKREDVFNTQDEISAGPSPGNTAVNKRVFSLWSRLNSLSPRGHELQHRRHLHAFYGLSDSDGGGVLTAETRATLLRPPGSPLRWG